MIEALDAQREAAVKEAKATAERFRQTAERSGESVECRIESCFSSACPEVINTHARYCEVASRRLPADSSSIEGLDRGRRDCLSS